MKRLLIVIDMQNDFVDGVLGFPGASAIIPVIARKIKDARADGRDVMFTMDTHEDDYLETIEGQTLPLHCAKGSHGWEIVPALSALKRPGDRVFEKPTFPSLALGNALAGSGYEDVELCGLVSHICVLANAFIVKAALPKARIHVAREATASFDPDLEDAAFAALEGCEMEVTRS